MYTHTLWCGYINLHAHQHGLKVLISPYLVLSDLKNFVSLLVMKWYLIDVLIFISLSIVEVEFFIYWPFFLLEVVGQGSSNYWRVMAVMGMYVDLESS